MAKFEIKTKMFDDPKTGNAIPYDRLVISGYIMGKLRVVELKVDKNQLEMISMIMDSDEQKPEVTVTKGGEVNVEKELEDEMDEFLND